MIFPSFQKLVDHLFLLKKKYSLVGIKAEFEAEGSSHNDIFLLRTLTNKVNTKLFVKIGGAEAINDIKFLLNINVDGIITPMIESKFAAWMFLSVINKSNLKTLPDLTINLESKTAIENIYEIFDILKNQVNNVTIGRTDLAASYFNKNIYPNSNFITKKIIEVSRIFKRKGININLGGGIDNFTIKKYAKNQLIKKNIDKIETRKVILPSQIFLSKDKALDAALKFEELYLFMKKEINKFNNKFDLRRLAILKKRK